MPPSCLHGSPKPHFFQFSPSQNKVSGWRSLCLSFSSSFAKREFSALGKAGKGFPAAHSHYHPHPPLLRPPQTSPLPLWSLSPWGVCEEGRRGGGGGKRAAFSSSSQQDIWIIFPPLLVSALPSERSSSGHSWRVENQWKPAELGGDTGREEEEEEAPGHRSEGASHGRELGRGRWADGQMDSQTASQLDRAPIAQWRKGEHGSAFALGIVRSCNAWAEGGQRRSREPRVPLWGSADLGEVFFPCSQLLCLVPEEHVLPPSSHSKPAVCPPLSRPRTATRATGLGVGRKQCCHCPSEGATK